jgi:DNA-binding XRE family transcriptional regulator
VAARACDLDGRRLRVPSRHGRGDAPNSAVQYRDVTDAELFGARLKELRESRNISQEKLAQASDLTTSFVSTVERGRKTPSLTTVLKLARGLKVDAAELFSGFSYDVLRKLKL